MIIAIIFDLHGTMWDSTGCACDIWNRVLGKHNDIDFEMTKENGAILYDGLEETLKELRYDYKLYIVSNCQDGY